MEFKKNINKKQNYVMDEMFDAEQLVIGKLEYISSEVTEFGPQTIRTEQIYIFEPVLVENSVKNKMRYREVFTGFIFDIDSNGTFDLPYVVEPQKLTEVLTNYQGSKIPKAFLLLTLDEIIRLAKENEDEKRKKLVYK